MTYMDDLLGDLRNPSYAEDYLRAAYQEGSDAFSLAVRDVIRAAQEAMRERCAEVAMLSQGAYDDGVHNHIRALPVE